MKNGRVMDFPEPSLFESDEHSRLLVRDTGTNNIELVRSALDGLGITYALGARRKDDVDFFTKPEDIQRSREAILRAKELG